MKKGKIIESWEKISVLLCLDYAYDPVIFIKHPVTRTCCFKQPDGTDRIPMWLAGSPCYGYLMFTQLEIRMI